MQRSNNPAVPPGGSTRPARQLNQPQQNHPLPYAQPTAQHQPAQQPVPPTDQLSQHVQRQPAQRPASYAPQFDPYQSQQAAAPPQQYAPAPQPYDHHAQPAHQPAYAQQSYNQPPQPYTQPAGAPGQQAHAPAYDQWSEQAGTQHSQHGYDLGGFAAPQHDPHYQHAYDPSQQAAGDWDHAHGHEPSLDHGAYQQDPHGVGGLDHHGEYADDEEGYEYEDAPRGRFMKIAAALVGAIVVGGGLAFAYTSLIVNESGKPPVIKSASGPSKIKPADPGGKKFANAESKLMGRLNEGSASVQEASGVRKVAVVPVSPDGTIMPPAVTAANNTTANDAFPVAGATLAPPGASLADAPLSVAPPGAAKPAQQLAAKTVETLNAAKPADPPPAPVKKVVAAAVAPAPAVKKPSVPATTAAVPASTGAGYVAVLASVPVSNTSRIAALQQFADMQQKYGSVLQNKMPDVKEANLGAKGTYHRLVVGPPGSRQGAQAFCGSLKAAGYGESCWVTAY